MTKEDQITELNKGYESWNRLRHSNWGLEIDLSGIELRNIDLSQYYLSYSNLSGTVFSGVKFDDTKLIGCELQNSKFINCDGTNTFLSRSDLFNTEINTCTFLAPVAAGTKFHNCNIIHSDIFHANFISAEFNSAVILDTYLNYSTFAKSNLTKCLLKECHIYGINTWDIIGEPTQENLIVSERGPGLSLDNIKVAQFLYLMIENSELRNIIDTITSKVVLILGRFYTERKEVLDAIKAELKKKGFVPVIFDFVNAENRNLTETIKLLGAMSSFIVADITDAKSIPQELSHIVPFHSSIPVVPIIQSDQKEYAMMESFYKYPWVLKLYEYENKVKLIEVIDSQIIGAALKKMDELKK